MKKSKLTVGAKVYVTMGTHVGRYGEVVGDYDCHGYYPVRIHAVRETGRFRRGQLEDQLDLELWELSNAASKSGDGEWRAPIDQPHALPEGATTDVDEPLGSSRVALGLQSTFEAALRSLRPRRRRRERGRRRPKPTPRTRRTPGVT